MKTTLNDKVIEAATSKGKPQADFYDAPTPGLALRVSKDGKKSWTFVYTSPRDQKRARMTFGTFPATTLKDARLKASLARGHVEQGTDPRDMASAAVDKPKTIAELIEERLAMKVRGKKRRAAETEWRYAKYVTPLIGNVPVKDFQIDPHYNKVVDPVMARGKMRMAGLIYQDLNTLFNFAIQRGVVEYSRMARVERPDTYVPRDRFLTAEEIKAVWFNLPAAIDQTKSLQRLVKLLLATGQRLQECAGISRGEIDFAKRLWTIPAARAKNNTQHVLPLNDVALTVLRECVRETNGEYLFPNNAGDGPQMGRNIDTTLARAQQPRDDQPLGKFGIPVWKPHDLRRTVATHMSRLEVPHLNISHVLNHITNTKGTVTQAVYDKHDYLAEKKAATDKWGAFLAKLVGEDVEQKEAA